MKQIFAAVLLLVFVSCASEKAHENQRTNSSARSNSLNVQKTDSTMNDAKPEGYKSIHQEELEKHRTEKSKIN